MEPWQLALIIIFGPALFMVCVARFGNYANRYGVVPTLCLVYMPLVNIVVLACIAFSTLASILSWTVTNKWENPL